MLYIQGHRSQIRDLAFSPEGKRLASVAGNGYTVSLWDASTGKRNCYLSSTSNVAQRKLLFAADGKTLYALNVYHFFQSWDLETRTSSVPKWFRNQRLGVLQHFFVADDGDLFLVFRNWMIFDRIGTGLVIGRHRFAVLDRGKMRKVGQCDHSSHVRAISLSPDNSVIALAGNDKKVRLRELTGDSTTQEIPKAVGALEYSPDGSVLAMASGQVVHLWDVKRGEWRGKLRGHQRVVNKLAFTPTGESLITASNDETVRVWDMASQRETRAMEWGIGPVTTLSIATDGMRAAAGGKKAIIVWDLDE